MTQKRRIAIALLGIATSIWPWTETQAQEDRDWTQFPPPAAEMPDSLRVNAGLTTTDSLAPELSEILEDERLRPLVDLYTDRQKGKIRGYRVQIFSASGPGVSEEAKRVLAEFNRTDFDIPAHLDYDLPNFLVQVGDFRTRLEAEKYKRMLQEAYPSSYIVMCDIKLPQLKQPESPQE